MARLRRGRMPMDVGAVCVEEPGAERSDLAPGVCVDRRVTMTSVAHRTTAEECAPRLSALARTSGRWCAPHLVVRGDGARWIGKRAEEPFPGTLQIVDEEPAHEHVWDVARAAFAADPLLRD
jgi:hypothetical protein